MADETERELSRPVATRREVAELAPDERELLARWLTESGPDQRPTLGGARRRVALLVASAAAIALVPWITVLGLTLPDRIETHAWRLTWVGFDVALLAGLALTALLGWRNRQLVVSALLVTATLLFCDAWFDLTLSWGTHEELASIVTAVAGELPFGLLLVLAHHRLVRTLTDRIWRDRGLRGTAPPLRRQPLLVAPSTPAARTRR